jgi:DNA repair photolyase
VNGYSKGVIEGKPNPGLVTRLKTDLDDFVRAEMPKGPVHISNSTDPFQARLEEKYGDTYLTLKLLSEYRAHFSEIIILTKNPGLIFNSKKDYVSVLDTIKDILTIEISVALYRNSFKLLEPGAPNPEDRLFALQKLISSGFNVRLRLDPIFPTGNDMQSRDDIVNILNQAEGVECVISKPLRLLKPKKGQPDQFYNSMSKFYQGGKKCGVEWHGGRYVFSAERAKKEMEFLSTECENRGVPLVHCKDTVLVDDKGVPLIKNILPRN